MSIDAIIINGHEHWTYFTSITVKLKQTYISFSPFHLFYCMQQVKSKARRSRYQFLNGEPRK